MDKVSDFLNQASFFINVWHQYKFETCINQDAIIVQNLSFYPNLFGSLMIKIKTSPSMLYKFHFKYSKEKVTVDVLNEATNKVATVDLSSTELY